MADALDAAVEAGVSPLPALPGIERGAYDLVAVLDVVEHIEDDVAALAAMKTLLKPGGKILIAVPAHQWLWSAHDVVNHHHRRYSKATLRAAITAAGLKPARLSYFNSLLFPLAAAARIAGLLQRLVHFTGSASDAPARNADSGAAPGAAPHADLGANDMNDDAAAPIGAGRETNTEERTS